MSIYPGWVPFYTSVLLDNIVAAESNALSDANKDALKMIISCGMIDMQEGTSNRTKFFNLFPDGTTTYANVMAVLEHNPPSPV